MQTHTDTAKEPRKAPAHEDAPTLYALAKDALEAHDNNADAAEDYLYEMLQSTPSMLRALARSAVRSAVATNVASVIGGQRRAAFDSVKAAEFGRKRAMALAEANATGLLGMPLADGTLLRDATRFEVMQAIEKYEKLSTTMAHRARWLRMIADIIPDGRRVGDVIDEKRVAELYKKAA